MDSTPNQSTVTERDDGTTSPNTTIPTIEGIVTDTNDALLTSLKGPKIRFVTQACVHCGAVHHGHFPTCRRCNNVLDAELYIHRLDQWEECDLITATQLKEKLTKFQSWSRVIRGYGQIHFTLNSVGQVEMKDNKAKVLFTGTPEQIESMIQNKTAPIVAKMTGNRNTETKVTKSAPKKQEGRGTSFRAQIFGHPVTAVIRWMGKDGFTAEEIMTVCGKMLETSPQPTTVAIQRSWGIKGEKPIPPLTEAEANQLRSLK